MSEIKRMLDPFLVKDHKDIPGEPHFVILMIYNHEYFDYHNPNQIVSLKITDYYAFPNKIAWELMINSIYKKLLDFHSNNNQFVYFYSGGSVKPTVVVKLTLSEQTMFEIDKQVMEESNLDQNK